MSWGPFPHPQTPDTTLIDFPRSATMLGANITGEALDWLGGVVRSCVPSLSKLSDDFGLFNSML